MRRRINHQRPFDREMMHANRLKSLAGEMKVFLGVKIATLTAVPFDVGTASKIIRLNIFSACLCCFAFMSFMLMGVESVSARIAEVSSQGRSKK